jgi:hypothetical protein
MNNVNFISERNYLMSSKIHNKDLIDDDQNNICYLETKYGKNNIHNLIKINKNYKNKYENILEQCKECKTSDYRKYLDNGLNCLTCTNNYQYLSKNEEQYSELINKYILELESLKLTLETDNKHKEIKKDLKNLYNIKNIALKKSLEYLIKYKELICKTNKVLHCYTLNDQINILTQKINISNIELVYIMMNINNKDVTEILNLLNEYKLTYNLNLFNRIKEIEKKNVIIENFSNPIEDNEDNYIFLLLILLILLILAL